MWVPLITLLGLFNCAVCNNFCPKFEDFLTLETNPDCWYDPESDLDTAAIIKRHGYECETHQLITDDGYYLTLFRIPHNGTNINDKSTPVILQHGIGANSNTWVPPIGKVAFLLSNQGLDVWIPNIRSSIFSLKHKHYDTHSKQFWNYSFHELGIFDVPKIIEFVVLNTGQKVIYMGHSMGTTMGFVYASMMPNHAQKHVVKIVALAPVAHMQYSRGITRIGYRFFVHVIETLYEMKIYGFGIPTRDVVDLVKRLCRNYPFLIVCSIIVNLFIGSDCNSLYHPHSQLAMIDSWLSLSLKTCLHFFQIIEYGEFRAYDYGSETNLKIYKSPEPPAYNISKINVPVYLFYGKRDPYSTQKDVEKLFSQLETTKFIYSVFHQAEIQFDHVDFVISDTLPEFYKLIMEYIREEAF